jgi:GlpG protein
MLATYVAVFAAEFVGANGLTYLEPWPWLLGRGEMWRLITATLMHGSVLHIAFNLYMFVRFSYVIENWLGPWVNLLLYAVFAAGSSAAQLLISAVEYHGPFIVYSGLVGASGVVYGYFGLLWVLRRRRDDAAEAVSQSTIQYMLAWLAVCFVVNLFGGHIANTAHVAGLGLGWLAGQCFVATRRTRWPIVIGTCIVSCLLPLLTWGPVWHATLAYVPMLNRRFDPDPPPERIRDAYEHPDRDTRQQQPGLF